MSKAQNKKVEIFKRLNKLKLKAGIPMDQEEDVAGFIEKGAIKSAQTIIDEKEKDYAQEVEAVLMKLDSTWSDLKDSEPLRRKYHLSKLYNFSNNVKDLAETYGYQLMTYFALSLRDFCESFDTENEAHHIIVQAHIDVMWVIFHENIKDDGGPTAEELKKVVATAIKKHS